MTWRNELSTVIVRFEGWSINARRWWDALSVPPIGSLAKISCRERTRCSSVPRSSVADDDDVTVRVGRRDANHLLHRVEALPGAAVHGDPSHALPFGGAKTYQQCRGCARGWHLHVGTDLPSTCAALDCRGHD